MVSWFHYDLREALVRSGITKMLASAQFPKNIRNATVIQINVQSVQDFVSQSVSQEAFGKDLDPNLFDSSPQKLG